MAKRRVGLWLIGACGSVGSTAALGLSAIARGIQVPTGMVTASPICHGLPLDPLELFVVGGHDIRRGRFLDTVQSLHDRSNIFSAAHIEMCRSDLETWAGNVRPGTVLQSGASISALADMPEVQQVRTGRRRSSDG